MQEKITQDVAERTVALAKRIRPVLITFGTPKDVLGACTVISMIEARESGATRADYIKAIEALADVFW